MNNEPEIKVGQKWKSTIYSAAVHTVIFVGQNAAFMKNREGEEFAIDLEQLRKFYDLVPETLELEVWVVLVYYNSRVDSGVKMLYYPTEARALIHAQEFKTESYKVSKPFCVKMSGELL